MAHHPHGSPSSWLTILMAHHPHGSPSSWLTILMAHHPHGSPSSWLTISWLTILMAHHPSPPLAHHPHGSPSSWLPSSWLTILMAHHPHGSPSSWLTILMAHHPHGSPPSWLTSSWLTTLMAHHPHGSPSSWLTILMAHHPHGSPSSWLTTLMAHHPHGSPSSWHTILMAHHPHGSPPSWLTILMAHHPHGSPPSWLTILMAPTLMAHILMAHHPHGSPSSWLTIPWLTTLMAHHPHCVELGKIYDTVDNLSTTLFPTSLQNITVTPINGSTILVSWNPLSPVEARGFVRYYLVTWTPSSSKARGTAGSANLTADATMFLITGLDPMVTYTISVSAGTSAGVGAATNVTISTPPTSAPASPSVVTSVCGTSMMICAIPIAVVAPLLVIGGIIALSIALIKFYRSKPQDDAMESIALKPIPNTTSHLENIAEESENGENELNASTIPPQVSTRGPLHIKDFAAHVNLMHQDRNKMFDREFQSIPECQHPTETAALPCNKGKNRFHNISPYDYNRVLLQKMEGVEGSDYINASVIDVNYDGYKKTHAYIMAQGPMPNTVGDFWRMIVENKLDTIVMLTQCNEGGKCKCEQYWSDNVGETIEPFPGLRVTLEEATSFVDTVNRKMRVELAGSAPLTVSHYQYEGWPDTGVPSSATSFIGFIRRVRSDNKQDGRPPMVVHCSSGVGRSGVFIILDSMLEQLKVKDTVNVCEHFADMRRQRSYTIETLDEYVFIHDAFNELIACGHTRIESSELRAKVNDLHKVAPRSSHSGFEKQLELLERFSYKPTDSDTSEARQLYNTGKNRYEDRIPYNISLARLKPTGVQGAEYINASCIDGYKVRNAYIAAQAPLQNTVEDFWRMVWEFKSLNIVMLCHLDEDRVVQYWPMRSGETLVYGKMAVTLIGNPDVSSKDQITVYRLEVKEEKTPAQGNTVNLFHYTGWPENYRPSENSPVIKMNKALLKAQDADRQQVYNSSVQLLEPELISAFITIHAMMERLKTEHVVDLFQFIKSSRAHRQNFVTNLEEYIFCHEALAHFADTVQAHSKNRPQSYSTDI
eukprot:Em0011g1201a